MTEKKTAKGREAEKDTSKNLNEALKDCLLEEYKTLKAEQLRRLTTRDNIFYLTIAALAGALTLATRTDESLLVLLAVPWLCLLLGWLHIVNDQKIVDIRKYIREILDPRLKLVLHDEGDVFCWEQDKDSMKPRRTMDPRLKRSFHFVAKLMAFVFPGAAALAWFFCEFQYKEKGILGIFIIALAVFESVFLLILGLMVDRYIGIRNAEGK